MNVVPRIKRRPLAHNEIRVINVNQDAIAELLLEHLMDHKSNYFEVPRVSSDTICCMNWDQKNNNLTYAIMPIQICFNGYELDFDILRQTVGITVESLFSPNRFKSLVLTKEMIKKQTRDNGTGAI